MESWSSTSMDLSGEAERHLPEENSRLLDPAEMFDNTSIWEHGLNLQLTTEAATQNSLESRKSDNQGHLHCQSARYASRQLLCPWFPQADPDHSRAKTFRSWWSRRKTVLLQACITSIAIFLLNVIGTYILQLRHPDSQLFSGDCASAARLDSTLHILVNVLSSLLLGASNLCMQLLSAPTRAEVDKAHAQRQWLDIGIPSIRNLRYIAWQRRLIWVLLAISSLPLHILFNSAIINVEPNNSYVWAVVKPSFLSGQEFDLSATQELGWERAKITVWGLNSETPQRLVQGQLGTTGDIVNVQGPKSFQLNIARIQREVVDNHSSYAMLSTVECLRRYTMFERDASDVVLVSSNDTLASSMEIMQSDNSLLATYRWGNNWVWVAPHKQLWECGTSNTFSCFRPQSWLGEDSVVADWNVLGYKIDYCLSKSQDLGEKCVVRVEIPIMIAICVANLVKCACIIYTVTLFALVEPGNTPLSTLGDAAASFLALRDDTTRGMSLADRTNIESLWKQKEPQAWAPRKQRWYAVSSLWTWLGTILACSAVLLTGIVFLILGISSTSSMIGSTKLNIAGLGFGRPSQYEKSFGGGLGAYMGRPRLALYASIAWANSWQVVISILYVQYNAQLSAFLMGDEWSRFVCEHTETSHVDSSSTSSSRRESAEPGASVLRSKQIWSSARPSVGSQKLVRKTLRVSAPQGIQRSSYFVSMPLRYGIPLISTTALLHWLLSQSLFVVSTETWDGDGSLEGSISTSAYSLEAIIVTIAVGSVLVLVLFILGMRRYPGNIPLASSCSAAISAACHPPPGDDEPHLFPVQWGVVSYTGGVGHCALSTDRYIEPPVVGNLYA